MDAGVRALTAYLDETWDALLKAVAGVDEAVLHWSPGPEFNSVAILLRHLRAPFGLSTVSSGCGRPPMYRCTAAFRGNADISQRLPDSRDL